jgi:hypothetical protein
MLNPKPRVTRMRQLTPGQVQRLDALRKVAQLLDSAFVVPGTSMRIGLDPIAGLVPAIGDLISPLFTIGILWQSRELGIPKVVQLRMIFNVAIDTVLGLLPVLGDLFDFAWKANDMNMALLDRHAYEEHRPTPGDWLFVLVMVLLLIVIAAVPFLVLGSVLGALLQLF